MCNVQCCSKTPSGGVRKQRTTNHDIYVNKWQLIAVVCLISADSITIRIEPRQCPADPNSNTLSIGSAEKGLNDNNIIARIRRSGPSSKYTLLDREPVQRIPHKGSHYG